MTGGDRSGIRAGAFRLPSTLSDIANHEGQMCNARIIQPVIEIIAKIDNIARY
jgi:hypothetical protein